MSDDGSAKAKKRRKAPLPDFRTIQYERPVAKKDFIKTNAANAKRNIVMKKEPKRVYIRDNEDNEIITEVEQERRPSVKPSYMSRDTYGKIPKYLAKRKTEGADGEPSEDALLVKSTIPKKSALAGRPSKLLDKDKPRNTTTNTARKTPWPEPDEVVNGEKRKSVKGESRLERMDSERHVRIAAKLGDEPAKRRSSSRIPRRNSSDMLPVARDRRKSSIHQTQIRRGSRIPVSKTDLHDVAEPRRMSVRRESVHRRSSQPRTESPKYAPQQVKNEQSGQQRELNDLRQAGLLNYNWPMAIPFGAAQMLLPPIPMTMMPGPANDSSLEGKLKRLEQLERYYQQAHIQHLQAMAAAAQQSSGEAHRKANPSKEPFKIVKGDQDGTWLLKPSDSTKHMPNGRTTSTMNSDSTDVPYIIATTQNIYIPANYPTINPGPHPRPGTNK
jgi:hypothetical protein